MAELETSLAAARGSRLGRRSLMKSAGVGAVTLGAAGAGIVGTTATASAAALTDADILNFALNLEYLEAEYYLRATTGQPLVTYTSVTGGDGTAAGAVNGGSLVPFQNPGIAYYALRIANDELSHVKFLREALGTAAIAEPAIDFVNSFTILARSAGLIDSTQSFDPFESEVNFLIGSYVFEDVGVTAYAGAASSLTSPINLSYAASVLAVEGYHAGAIRGYLSQIGAGNVTNAISALRAKLSGVADNGTAVTGNPYNFSNVDYNGQVQKRTPQQVLNIVYGAAPAAGATVSSGGFFPVGMNGNIKSSTG